MALILLVIGTSMGSAFLAMAVLIIRALLQTSQPLKLGAVLSIGGLSTAAVALPQMRHWLPDRVSQVPGSLLSLGRKRAAFSWGLELGTGYRSFSITPALYGMTVVATAQHSILAAGLIPLFYGAVRGSVIAFNAALIGHRNEEEKGIPGVGLEKRLRIPLLVLLIASLLMAILWT